MNEFPYFIKEIEKYNKTKKREKFFCWLEFSLKKREIFSFDKVIITTIKIRSSEERQLTLNFEN